MKTSNLKFLFLLLFAFAHSAFAASLDFKLERNTADLGQVFPVSVVLNTEGESINAFEGDFNYDSRLLSIENINTGSSFVNLWLEKPEVREGGIIHFSGITPGGVSTTNGELFSLVFKTKELGQATFTLNNINFLINDGLGTKSKVAIENTSVDILNTKTSGAPSVFLLKDKIAPEKFSIFRSRDTALFDDKYFIVFNTTDKDSGIAYYKVCELFFCKKGESPFLLKNQSPFYRVVVEAYDQNGNMFKTDLTSNYFVLLVTLLISVIFYIIFHFLRKKL